MARLVTFRQRAWSRVEETVLRGELAQRRYFAIPNNDACGAIRINLAGREPDGRVRPEELDAVCAGIERELCRVIDLDTGAPAVRRVVRASDHHARAPMDDLPDLLVEWNGDRPIVRARTRAGVVVEGYDPDYRTGAIARRARSGRRGPASRRVGFRRPSRSWISRRRWASSWGSRCPASTAAPSRP